MGAWGGRNEVYQNNTCVTRDTAGPGISPYPAPDKSCSYEDQLNRTVLLRLAHNSYWTPANAYQVSCGGLHNLSSMQSMGQEIGSRSGPVPPERELLDQARHILGMSQSLTSV